MTKQKTIGTFRMAAFVLGTLAMGGLANAASIGIFNTGVDGTGTPLADGTVGDPHYVLTSVPSLTTDILVRTSVGGFPIGPWLGDDGISAWIGPNNDTSLNGPTGLYDYQTTFDLTGLDPLSAFLTGQWAADNEGVDILINGVSTANTAGGFTAWSPFTISSGFVSGVNTLDFLVNNDGGPTGLRVELSGTADSLSGVPEPASFMMIGLGLVGLGVRAGRVRLAKLGGRQ
jgi:hypothetical protein